MRAYRDTWNKLKQTKKEEILGHFVSLVKYHVYDPFLWQAGWFYSKCSEQVLKSVFSTSEWKNAYFKRSKQQPVKNSLFLTQQLILTNASAHMCTLACARLRIRVRVYACVRARLKRVRKGSPKRPFRTNASSMVVSEWNERTTLM
jgi:hypothetical protein